MKAMGCHIIAEMSHCNEDILSDLSKIKDIMVKAALEAKAIIKETAFHRFMPQGVSGVVVIAESHLSIHTWPELGYAAVDVYTCGEKTKPNKACEYLAKYLGAKDVSITEIKRGLPNSSNSFTHIISRSNVSGGDQIVQSA